MTVTVSAEWVFPEPGFGSLTSGATATLADGRIAAVQPEPSCRNGLLLMPALSDAHDHGRGTRSVAAGAPDLPLELWLPLLGQEPRVDPYVRAAVAFGRAALAGVGAINHCHNPQRFDQLVDEAKGVARAATEVGIRVAFGVPLRDRNYFGYGNSAPIKQSLGATDFAALVGLFPPVPVQQQLDWIDELAACENEFFSLQYGPVAPQWCSDALLTRIAERSHTDGRRVHMHLFETKRQREWADAAYPSGLIQRLDALGILTPRTTVAHGVWLRPEECEILAARGVTVSVNTSSNLRLGSGLARVGAFKAAGLTWAMGLDGMSFDDDDDALREMRLLWHSQKGSDLGGAIDRDDLFRAVFVSGRPTVTPIPGGAIKTDLAADLVLMDYQKMAWDRLGGVTDELDMVLTRARKEFVHSLIVAGRPVVSDGKVQTVSLADLERELLDQARQAWSQTAANTPLRRRYQAALAEFYERENHIKDPDEP